MFILLTKSLGTVVPVFLERVSIMIKVCAKGSRSIFLGDLNEIGVWFIFFYFFFVFYDQRI